MHHDSMEIHNGPWLILLAMWELEVKVGPFESLTAGASPQPVTHCISQSIVINVQCSMFRCSSSTSVTHCISQASMFDVHCPLFNVHSHQCSIASFQSISSRSPAVRRPLVSSKRGLFSTRLDSKAGKSFELGWIAGATKV